MNCNFLESEYFYHTQTQGQGESDSFQGECEIIQPLNLRVSQSSNSIVELTEQASVIAEPITSIVEPPRPPMPEYSSPPPVISEVIPEPSSENTIIAPDISGVDENENAAVDGDTGRYILPPRSTQGIPPKRYSPDRGSRGRYPMANLAKGNLTEMARTFEAALYEEEELPRTAEEAMKIPHWREAMLVEMRALMENKTWEICLKPDGVRTVGCRWVFTIKRGQMGRSNGIKHGW